MTASAPQRFRLVANGHRYELEVAGTARNHLVLRRDGEVVDEKRAHDERVTLTATPNGAVHVKVRLTRLGRVRRATLTGGGRELDLDPEPGSPAARRLEKERAHPTLYGVLDVLVAAAGVLIPLLGLGALVSALLEPVLRPVLAAVGRAVAWVRDLIQPVLDLIASLLPSFSWPSIDWPDIDIPWPRIDLSWLPDWTPPPWLAWVLDHVDLLWPVLLAAGLARHEVTRRAKQDALKAQLAEQERRALLTRIAGDLRALERELD